MGQSLTTKERKHEIIAECLGAIERDGASLRELAPNYGVTYKTLCCWLLGTVPDQYKEAQEKGLIRRIADADADLEQADSLVDVAKRNHQCKYVRWDAERRLKHLFAPRVETELSGSVKVVYDEKETARRLAFVMASQARTIEGSAVEVLEDTPSGVEDLF